MFFFIIYVLACVRVAFWEDCLQGENAHANIHIHTNTQTQIYKHTQTDKRHLSLECEDRRNTARDFTRRIKYSANSALYIQFIAVYSKHVKMSRLTSLSLKAI